MLTKEQINQIRELFYNLETIENIAKKLNISIPTVKKYTDDWFTVYEQFLFSQIAFDLEKQGKFTIKDKNYPLFDLSDSEYLLVGEEYERQIEFCPIKELVKKYIAKKKKIQ